MEKMQKSVVIIDCYAHSKEVEEKLYNCVQNLKRFKQDIMLISNTVIDKKVISFVDYYIYDSQNRLFTNGKYKADSIVLYNINDQIEIYEYVSGIQRHGLSVMRNLFKSIKIAKSYGYTHFHRVEVDDIMGNNSLDTISLIPRLNFNGVFYFNENDISFHYMYSSIDFFLDNVKEINEEQDYYEYLRDEMKSDKFRNVEEFVRHNLDKADLSNIKIRKGSEMDKEFPDTMWNTETSSSNLESKYNNCTTRIYKILNSANENTDNLAILSHNYSDKPCERKIQIVYNSGMIKEIIQALDGRGYWAYEIISNLISKILVFEGDSLLYCEENKDIQSYIKLKQ